MAIESFLRRLGLRKGHTPSDQGVPASILVYSNHESNSVEHVQNSQNQELSKYPGLEQYPEALAYLAEIGVSLSDLQSIYPDFEDYAENEFDDHGHAFRYMEGPVQKYRLDRVLFPSDTHYPYHLAVDRQMRYAPHRQHMIGIFTMPLRRVRVDVFPDTSVALQLQAATESDLTDMATFMIDPQGNVGHSDLAMRNSHNLNSGRTYEDRSIPRPLDVVKDQMEAQNIMYFSQQFLEQAWGLTEQDIAIPSTELTRRILTAPVEVGMDLKAMISG